ncbi:hypothetical protein CVT25_006646 [Psilocybe cyanescens]|uniref:Uncharacterized protein n=1 Tax=Psilocybe cyanescens TaxID=93625 RepID=A0A409X3Z3_PSICY|nr:hypothetical protein CVT25_006646 [Psilocybe cyanescens]
MAPLTQRVCLTAFDRTICFNIVTLEGLKQLVLQFHRDVCEYLIVPFTLWIHKRYVYVLILCSIVVQHPYISAAVLLLWSFYPQFPFYVVYFIFYVVPRSIILDLLACIGFEREGVRSDSFASRYQSRYYQGHTPRNGFFSGAQSYGTIHHEDLTTARHRETHPIVGIFWRFLGWLILYASLVVLLKYGGK